MGNRGDVVALLLKVVSLLHIRLLWFVCQVAKDLMQLWDVDWLDGVDKKRQWLRSTIVLRLEREFSQGFRQHQSPGGDGVGRGILIRAVAEAASAGDEQHGYRSYARHE